jgi:hypothetical protein
MSKSPIERVASNLYDDLPTPIRRVATSPPKSPAASILKKVIVNPTPVRAVSDAARIVRVNDAGALGTISDAAPRKAPSPPVSEPSTPLVALSASLSQKRRKQKEALETFQFVQMPNAKENEKEIEELRRKVSLLESKLEELQDTVRVRSEVSS